MVLIFSMPNRFGQFVKGRKIRLSMAKTCWGASLATRVKLTMSANTRHVGKAVGDGLFVVLETPGDGGRRMLSSRRPERLARP